MFATAESGAFDPSYEGRLENISDDPAAANFALQSGNTFVNTIYDAITYAGEKLWTNLPDSYPLVDLPTVTFTLSRSVGTDEPQSVATMTIQGSDWASLYRNGHYLFEFGHTGVNKPTADYDPEALPEDESPLPRFDNKGRLYTYTLTEAIDWAGTEAETEHSSGNIFDLLSSGETFANSYNKTGAARLSAVKYLTVSKDSVKYPAVTMVLSRTYTTANDQPSAPETIQTLVWNAKDVADAAGTAAPAADGTVTVEHTFVFDNLPVYAPNGSKYSYIITEKKDQLGGFTTWAAPGSLSADELLANDAYKGQTFVDGLTAAEDDVIDASFLNRPETSPGAHSAEWHQNLERPWQHLPSPSRKRTDRHAEAARQFPERAEQRHRLAGSDHRRQHGADHMGHIHRSKQLDLYDHRSGAVCAERYAVDLSGRRNCPRLLHRYNDHREPESTGYSYRQYHHAGYDQYPALQHPVQKDMGGRERRQDLRKHSG